MKGLRCGVLFGFRNPPEHGQDWTSFYADSFELIEQVDEVGFDTVWISEHHFSPDGYCPSVLPMAAAVAARTRRVRIGSNVIVLPLHHPLRLAEDVAMVDALSGGRFDLGVGIGYRQEEFDTFGISLKERVSRLEEGIDLMRRAWTEPVVNHRGRHFVADGLTVRPQPVQQPVPIWFGARAEVAVRRAGRLGDGFIISRGREQIRWFREGAEEAGRDPDSLPLATNRIVHVADSEEQALREIGEGLLYHENMYSQWFKSAATLDHEAELTDYQSVSELPTERYILGDPDTVTAKIEELREGYGFDELILWGRLPGVPTEVASRSLGAFAEHVLPRLSSTPPTTDRERTLP